MCLLDYKLHLNLSIMVKILKLKHKSQSEVIYNALGYQYTYTKKDYKGMMIAK